MSERGVQKKMSGVVVGDEMDKTVVVLVSRIKKERPYGKYVKRQKKYMAHDPQNKCKIGDTVKIIETRPLSRRKRWQILDQVFEQVPEQAPEQIREISPEGIWAGECRCAGCHRWHLCAESL